MTGDYVETDSNGENAQPCMGWMDVDYGRRSLTARVMTGHRLTIFIPQKKIVG